VPHESDRWPSASRRAFGRGTRGASVSGWRLRESQGVHSLLRSWSRRYRQKPSRCICSLPTRSSASFAARLAAAPSRSSWSNKTASTGADKASHSSSVNHVGLAVLRASGRRSDASRPTISTRSRCSVGVNGSGGRSTLDRLRRPRPDAAAVVDAARRTLCPARPSAIVSASVRPQADPQRRAQRGGPLPQPGLLL
jgi:hypothetical protein